LSRWLVAVCIAEWNVAQVRNQFHLPQPFLDRRTEFPLDYGRYALYRLQCCPLLQKWLCRVLTCILAGGDAQSWSKQTTLRSICEYGGTKTTEGREVGCKCHRVSRACRLVFWICPLGSRARWDCLPILPHRESILIALQPSGRGASSIGAPVRMLQGVSTLAFLVVPVECTIHATANGVSHPFESMILWPN
jgi:hypothetical protein